jgi:hypothetical protein
MKRSKRAREPVSVAERMAITLWWDNKLICTVLSYLRNNAV